ncbi:hypothetical protein BDP55DRAFT_630846 [Colletotrichum godetiae]|uniref:Uncharacterized protein n=1 Tax=Colletotrichum godetiae TaxID=1209918 RepID=A0AAJ0AQN8_9PEZI|nr:uncharacterized protein BDP55DRAFT_630846 [Colletotrichum godetiae]KAK1676757.1 hypothetical protein BDP55DRAFT_630846 [Colletotrichum godetiae]
MGRQGGEEGLEEQGQGARRGLRTGEGCWIGYGVRAVSKDADTFEWVRTVGGRMGILGCLTVIRRRIPNQSDNDKIVGYTVRNFFRLRSPGPHPASSVFGAKLELAWRGTRRKARKVPQIPATPAQVEEVAKGRSGRASSGRFHPNHRLREVLDTVSEHCVAPATPIRLSISRAGVGLLTMLAPLGDGPLCLFHSDGGYEKWGGPCEP